MTKKRGFADVCSEKLKQSAFATAILLCTDPGNSYLIPKNGTTAALTRKADERGQFIVAFELNEANGFSFTWPFESMQPSAYKSIAMIVERMPRVRNRSRTEQFIALTPSQHLKVNGRRQKPHCVARRETHFVVNLELGRLKLSAYIPPGTTLDARHDTARIRLYEK